MSNIRKTLIFIDEANIARSAIGSDDKKRYLDWESLIDFIKSHRFIRNNVVQEVFIFIGLPPNQPPWSNHFQGREKFVNKLRELGYIVITKEGQPRFGDDNSYKADMDVVMALEALTVCLDLRPDSVVLCTGDVDFVFLVNKLRYRGFTTYVASMKNSLSKTLRLSCSGLIELDSFVESCPPIISSNSNSGDK